MRFYLPGSTVMTATLFLVVAIPSYAADVFKVCVLASLTGTQAAYGTGTLNGVKLHQGQHPEQDRWRFEVLTRDVTNAEPTLARQLSREIAIRDGCHVLIAALPSQAARAVAETAKEKSIPYLETFAANSSLAADSLHNPFFFRISSAISQESNGAIEWFRREKVQHVVVATDAASEDIGKLFGADATRQLGKDAIMATKTINDGDPDISEAVRDIKDAKADILVVAITIRNFSTFGSALAKEQEAVRKKVMILGRVGSSEIVRLMGESYPVGIVASSPDNPNSSLKLSLILRALLVGDELFSAEFAATIGMAWGCVRACA